MIVVHDGDLCHGHRGRYNYCLNPQSHNLHQFSLVEKVKKEEILVFYRISH